MKYPGSVLFVAIVGALAITFGIGAVTWYIAHQFAWWTYAIFYMAYIVTYETGKALLKELHSDRRK